VLPVALEGGNEAQVPDLTDTLPNEIGKLIAPTPIGTLSMTLSKQNAVLYHYYRWMWIQFPLLASPGCSSYLSDILTSHATTSNPVIDVLSTARVALSRESVSQITKKRSQSANASLSKSPNSHFIGAASSATLPLEGMGEVTSQHRFRSTYSAPYLTPDEMKRRVQENRNWQAKKQDPSAGPVVNLSSHRTAAFVKARYPLRLISISLSDHPRSLTSVASLNAIESFGRHTLALAMNIPGVTDELLPHQAIDKYRYPLSVQMKGIKKIPHSQPSVRSMRNNTRFPTVVEQHKQKILEEKKSMDVFAVRAAQRYGGIVEDEDESISFQDELTRLHLTEKMKSLNKIGRQSTSLLYIMMCPDFFLLRNRGWSNSSCHCPQRDGRFGTRQVR
jgi:hypothetical protein